MRTNKGILTSVQAHKIIAQKINQALGANSKNPKVVWGIDAMNMHPNKPATLVKVVSK